jgi:hypothetical protein
MAETIRGIGRRLNQQIRYACASIIFGGTAAALTSFGHPTRSDGDNINEALQYLAVVVENGLSGIQLTF